MCGFSYASNINGEAQKATAKGTQQAKAFRRELYDTVNLIVIMCNFI